MSMEAALIQTIVSSFVTPLDSLDRRFHLNCASRPFFCLFCLAHSSVLRLPCLAGSGWSESSRWLRQPLSMCRLHRCENHDQHDRDQPADQRTETRADGQRADDEEEAAAAATVRRAAAVAAVARGVDRTLAVAATSTAAGRAAAAAVTVGATDAAAARPCAPPLPPSPSPPPARLCRRTMPRWPWRPLRHCRCRRWHS